MFSESLLQTIQNYPVSPDVLEMMDNFELLAQDIETELNPEQPEYQKMCDFQDVLERFLVAYDNLLSKSKSFKK